MTNQANMLHIVLVEPEIPQNTGNIARTCACLGAKLHLIEPMGFRLTERNLGRAAMDYWDKVDIARYPCVDAFMDEHNADQLYFFTGQSETYYNEPAYQGAVYLVFGRESRGLDQALIDDNLDRCVRIPMANEMRSLNLSNAAAIASYHVMESWNFEDLR